MELVLLKKKIESLKDLRNFEYKFLKFYVIKVDKIT